MTAADSAENSSKESIWPTVGLCLMAASSILVEICLTKFVSYKVYYHFVYAIISTVILSAGFAGTCVQMFPKKFGHLNDDPWNVASRASAIYAITLPLVTFLFCWLPFDPFTVSAQRASPWHSLPQFFLGSAPLALYFLLFAIPFFHAGIAISSTLVISKRRAGTLYFFDLLSAAIGAAICPAAMEYLGGYGTIIFAAALGMVAYFCYNRASEAGIKLKPLAAFIVISAGLFYYPGIELDAGHFDIVTTKTASWNNFIADLHGFNKTWWNAVARIDITNTGETPFFDSPRVWPGQPVYTCRFVLVDGAAPTRQLKVDGDPISDQRLGKFFWAGPYIANPNIKKEVIIGAGGGIDILIGKHFKAEQIDALEINPSTYKHILLGRDDSDASIYQPGIKSTDTTRVLLHNSEARHFCTEMSAQSVDLIQASTVDTLTAITSGAMSMVENYLYTSDAVRDYVRVLKPGGILSLTHWRNEPTATSLRMFVTYLKYLDGQGIKDPWRYIVVTGSDRWCNEMMKTTPFTADEVENIRVWAKANGYDVIFDPFTKNNQQTKATSTASIYPILGFLQADQRKTVLDGYASDLMPVTDDRPYFYKVGREDFFVSSIYFSTPVAFVLLVLISSVVLFLLPLTKIKKEALSLTMKRYAICFTLAGFAFLLSEIAILQLFTVFVGGPIYSLAVVLPCVLAGYATGSAISCLLKNNATTFAILGLVLTGMFALTSCQLPPLLHTLMAQPDNSRICICAAIVYLIYVVTGIPVSLALTWVKKNHGDLVAWTWGVSCASNAIGAMSFTLIAQITGIANILLIAAALYFCANVGFARLAASQTKNLP